MKEITIKNLKDFLSKTYEDWANSVGDEFVEVFDYMSKALYKEYFAYNEENKTKK